MLKKVLVVGAMYSPNLGDGVICQTVSEIVKKVLNAEPVVFGISGSTAFPKKSKSKRKYISVSSMIRNVHMVKKLRYYRLKHKLWKKLDLQGGDCDAIVFAGGQLFMDCFVNYIVWILEWAEEHNIRVVFNCCGMGKLSEKNRKLLENIFTFSCVHDISVRESTELFYKQFSKKISVERICDPAMEVADYYHSKSAKKCRIGIGVIHPINFRDNCVKIDKNQYVQILKVLIDWCSKQSVIFELFTNGDPLDTEFCNELADSLGCIENIAPIPMSPAQLVDIVTRYECIISFRLHSHIIATSYGIPTAAFIWDDKVEEFMRLIGRENRCLSMLRMPDVDEISDVLCQLLHDDNVLQNCGLELTSQRLLMLLGE